MFTSGRKKRPTFSGHGYTRRGPNYSYVHRNRIAKLRWLNETNQTCQAQNLRISPFTASAVPTMARRSARRIPKQPEGAPAQLRSLFHPNTQHLNLPFPNRKQGIQKELSCFSGLATPRPLPLLRQCLQTNNLLVRDHNSNCQGKSDKNKQLKEPCTAKRQLPGFRQKPTIKF